MQWQRHSSVKPVMIVAAHDFSGGGMAQIYFQPSGILNEHLTLLSRLGGLRSEAGSAQIEVQCHMLGFSPGLMSTAGTVAGCAEC